MDQTSEKAILQVLAAGKDMTIATCRSDGYPQATTVSYVNDGLIVYFGCSSRSQKARNIAHNNKVSLTVNEPYETWNEIRGISMGGTAAAVISKDEIGKVEKLMLAKFPEITKYADVDIGEIRFYRVTPKVISLLDYTKGFGTTRLVEV